MKSSCLLLLASLGLGTLYAHGQTGDAPRQLGTPPSMPTPVRTPTPAPRQLGQVPAVTAPAADTVRNAAPAPATGYGTGRVATADGALTGARQGVARYQVGLKDGKVFSASDVTQKNPLFGRPYLVLDGRQHLELAEVSFYEDESGHYVRTTLPGSRRETTLHRDKVGRLSLYSITTTQYSPGGYGMGGYGMGGFGGMPYGGYRTVKTEYFSKDNGPIQNLTQRNLVLATLENPGAQALLADAKRYQRFIFSSYVVGSGLLVAGLVQTLKGNGGGTWGISPLTYAAIPVLIVPLVLKSKRDQTQKQAIALYNSTQ